LAISGDIVLHSNIYYSRFNLLKRQEGCVPSLSHSVNIFIGGGYQEEVSYLGEFPTVSNDVRLNSNLDYSRFNSLKRREGSVPSFSHSVNIFIPGGYQEEVSYLGEFPTISHDVGLDSNLNYSRFNNLKRREGCVPSFSHTVNISISGGYQEEASHPGEFQTVSHDVGLDSNLNYSRFNTMKRREGCVPSFSHTVNIFISGGYQEGLSYLGEFPTVFHDVGLDSNLDYSRFNTLKRREVCVASFSHAVNIFISGGYQEEASYLGEFPTVSHDVGLDSNLDYSRFTTLKRREVCIPSFSHTVNIFIYPSPSLLFKTLTDGLSSNSWWLGARSN
jgi:hypothetical protein